MYTWDDDDDELKPNKSEQIRKEKNYQLKSGPLTKMRKKNRLK